METHVAQVKNRLIGRPPKHPKATRICKHCGETFSGYEWKLDSRGPRKFCSRQCYYKYPHRDRAPRDVSETRTCLICKQQFLVGGRGRPPRRAKYCSLGCASVGMRKHPLCRDMSETEAAWLAGIFDGEGSVVWTRANKTGSVRISVPNTCKPLIDKIVEVVGTGAIVERNVHLLNPKHSKCWVWFVCGENSRRLLRQMLPWLIVKKEKAMEVLALADRSNAVATTT